MSNLRLPAFARYAPRIRWALRSTSTSSMMRALTAPQTACPLNIPRSCSCGATAICSGTVERGWHWAPPYGVTMDHYRWMNDETRLDEGALQRLLETERTLREPEPRRVPGDRGRVDAAPRHGAAQLRRRVPRISTSGSTSGGDCGASRSCRSAPGPSSCAAGRDPYDRPLLAQSPCASRSGPNRREGGTTEGPELCVSAAVRTPP